MADPQKIENLQQSIADWQAKLDSGTAGFSAEVIQDIIAKLQADLAAEEAA